MNNLYEFDKEFGRVIIGIDEAGRGPLGGPVVAAAVIIDEYFEEFWPEYKNLDELKAHYQRGGLGDVKVKKFLNKVLQAELAPIRARRKEWEQKLPEVFAILKEGSKAAEAKAAETLQDVKAAMRINYFDDADFLN